MMVTITVVAAATLQSQTITRDDFLNRLRETHPKFQKELIATEIVHSERSGLLGAQDWNLSSSVFYSHEEPTLSFAGPERTDAFAISGGLQRSFWSTGARFSASFVSSHASLKIDPFFGFPGSFFENRLAVSYVHPLLKNRRGVLDRLEFDLKKFDIDFAEVRANENLENFLSSLSLKFLDWVFLNEQKNIIINRLELSKEELERTERKRKANLVNQADLIRTEDAVRFWEQNRVLAESHWKALQAELAVLAQDKGMYKASPVFDLYILEPETSLDSATEIIRSQSRLVKLLQLRINQLNQRRIGYVDLSRPDLSFVAELNLKEIDEAFGNSLVLDKPDATIGFKFSVPLKNRSAKSQIMKTDLQVMQLEKEIDDLVLSLEASYTNLYIQIRELGKVMALNKKQIESAYERTEEELRLYNQGRGELTFVIQSRDNEQNAQLTYAQNALVYHQLIVRCESLLDRIY